MYATIGQRKGLNIGGTSDGNGEPWYVVDKDIKNNTLIVAQGHGSEALMAYGLMAVTPLDYSRATIATALYL